MSKEPGGGAEGTGDEAQGGRAAEGAGSAGAAGAASAASSAAGAGGAAGAGSAAGAGDVPAGELLSELSALRHRVRAARHAYWFPLALFGLIGCGAVPFYLAGGPQAGVAYIGHNTWIGSPVMPVFNGHGFLARASGYAGSSAGALLGFYWLLALVGGFLVMTAWYRRHARRAGVTSPARGAAITGIVLTVLALVLPPIAQSTRLTELSAPFPWFLVIHGAYPFLIIAVVVCVLAWEERSRALALIAVVYLAATVVACSYDVENLVGRLGLYSSGTWYSVLPNLALPVLVLLLSALAAYAVGRQRAAA
jgi:hypothetical protein